MPNSRASGRVAFLFVLYVLSFVGVILGGMTGNGPVYGLNINTNYVPAGSNIVGVGTAVVPTSNLVGGGDLASVVRAAADTWEALILDDFTLTLNFGWYPTSPFSNLAFHQGVNAGGIPNREKVGSLAFNSASSAALFLDPTPESNEEFVFNWQAFGNYGGGSVETRRDFSGATPETLSSHDMYSSALHEIGHALGLSDWSFFNTETVDGDIDVGLAPFSGTTLPMNQTHLGIAGPVMSFAGRPAGTRRDITQVDLLAVCQLSHFTQCNLDLRPTGPSGDFDEDGDVDGKDFLDWQRGLSGSPQSSSDLAAWEASYGAPSSVATSSVATNGTVPEPTSLFLTALALATFAVSSLLPRHPQATV